MGETRDARKAGTTDATTVVTVPTIRATTMVRGSTWSVVVGRPIPNAFSSPSSPRAMTNPKPNPTAEAITPTITASASTDRRTCLALAPRARSSASSRVRWATRMENVLKMVNAATNSEIPANTSSAMLKKDRFFLMSSEDDCAACEPVFAS